ncbi:uncharacterized protein [Physcomitrium patens]|uniref:Methyltransferase FkbM domain-containing protein n=1 Tax=Physcomitrium patens TaxID=3218 RepID=A0A2K1JQ04_PHYPA|nr:uncharacterized protein LOC112289688 isoform X1 [Physcomitrium patens]PNR43618.1 hypothetical protein PHYPA_015999 [Physcomitrium patens]|eukprot:XP_024390896.1 uncharacterized protein LOC112289688 isoform X1 [Physcomitrella patens]
MTLVASRGRMKVVVMVVVLIGLWFTLVQYDNTCTLGRKEELSRNMAGFSKGLAGQQNGDAGFSTDQESSMELSGLLKEAMQHGQVGKPTIHLVEIMEAMSRPFFMFVCSNCYCDICDKVRNLGYWSPVESMIFHTVLKRHGCRGGRNLVIDIGAHVGYFSLIAASYGCRVKSFEPNSVALRYLNLSRALNNYDQINLFQKGVGQADTKAMYKQTDTWALNGFLRRRLLETVEVTRLDSIVDEDVLLMKIDTEGYEVNVFAGAKNLLSEHRVHHILAEVKQAGSPSKRELLYTIAKTGQFTHVYNWDEVITPLSVPLDQFTLQNATIVDVTSIVLNKDIAGYLQFQDFWFCREPLPWL